MAMIPRGLAGVESGERQRRVVASGSSLRSKAVMDARAVNVAILVLLILELATGPGSFLVGEPGGRWVF